MQLIFDSRLSSRFSLDVTREFTVDGNAIFKYFRGSTSLRGHGTGFNTGQKYFINKSNKSDAGNNNVTTLESQ